LLSQQCGTVKFPVRPVEFYMVRPYLLRTSGMVSLAAPATSANLGFLSILHESAGYLGGYLVTNQWGRPLEFRLSSAIQPNRVQQILYGTGLEPYLCADLIGKTLVEKSATAAQIVLTDHPAALDLRRRVDIPVALVKMADSAEPLSAHPHFENDAPALRDFLERLGHFDFAEPFARIREAIAEARKLGVAGRN
jgi:hypothetical protein